MTKTEDRIDNRIEKALEQEDVVLRLIRTLRTNDPKELKALESEFKCGLWINLDRFYRKQCLSWINKYRKMYEFKHPRNDSYYEWCKMSDWMYANYKMGWGKGTQTAQPEYPEIPY